MAILKDALVQGDLVATGDIRATTIAVDSLTGTPKAPTASAGTNNTQIATTAFVTTAINNAIGSALLASY